VITACNTVTARLLTLFIDSVHKIMNLKRALFICMTVRLAGSGLPHEGRLEVYHNNQWGTVCGYFFDHIDATVACRSLFGSGLTYCHCYLSLKSTFQ